MDEFILRIVDLPPKVNAVTVLDENGDFNVYVNSSLSDDAKKDAFDHETRHIKRKHFFSVKPVEVCEKEAKRS